MKSEIAEPCFKPEVKAENNVDTEQVLVKLEREEPDLDYLPEVKVERDVSADQPAEWKGKRTELGQ